jgi:hypothetical protein
MFDIRARGGSIARELQRAADGPTPSILSLDGLPDTAKAGIPIRATVIVKDAAGALFGGYRGTVHFASTDPGAVLPPDYTFTTADAGRHDFADAISFKKAGLQAISVTEASDASIGSTSPVSVIAAGVAAYAVSLPEPSMTAGVQGTLAVKAVDAFGNLATDYSGSAMLVSSDPKGTLPDTAAFTSGEAHDISISFKTAGTQSIALTDSSNALIFGGALTAVLAGSASAFAILQVPARVELAGLLLFQYAPSTTSGMMRPPTKERRWPRAPMTRRPCRRRSSSSLGKHWLPWSSRRRARNRSPSPTVRR